MTARIDRTPADDRVRGAAIREVLELLLPAMRTAARGCGYAIAVHGSLCRDIDIVAVPWVARASDATTLIDSIIGAARGVVQACNRTGGLDDKPHGRRAQLLIAFVGGTSFDIDLSIMPTTTIAPTSARGDKTAWLIEHADSSPDSPLYFVSIDVWTRDPNNATAFSRLDVAERIAGRHRRVWRAPETKP